VPRQVQRAQRHEPGLEHVALRERLAVGRPLMPGRTRHVPAGIELARILEVLRRAWRVRADLPSSTRLSHTGAAGTRCAHHVIPVPVGEHDRTRRADRIDPCRDRLELAREVRRIDHDAGAAFRQDRRVGLQMPLVRTSTFTARAYARDALPFVTPHGVPPRIAGLDWDALPFVPSGLANRIAEIGSDIERTWRKHHRGSASDLQSVKSMSPAQKTAARRRARLAGRRYPNLVDNMAVMKSQGSTARKKSATKKS